MLIAEYHSAPGTCFGENTLIFGDCGCILNEMDLHESTELGGQKLLKFRGKLQEAGAVNKNRRIYPKEILEDNVDRLTESIQQGGLVGELDHPTDSIVHFSNASHKITKLWWEDSVLFGEGVVLPTPSGKILKELMNCGVRVGMSSRGVGNGKVNEDGILVIGESYKLITFDAVADPSTYAAFQEKVTTSTKESYQPRKNENSGIYRDKEKLCSKELLIACLGGIVQKQAQVIKGSLSNG